MVERICRDLDDDFTMLVRWLLGLIKRERPSSTFECLRFSYELSFKQLRNM